MTENGEVVVDVTDRGQCRPGNNYSQQFYIRFYKCFRLIVAKLQPSLLRKMKDKVEQIG